MRLIVGVPRRNWLPRPVRPAQVMCAVVGRKRNGLIGESAGETDANNDRENSFNSGVQRADDTVEFFFLQVQGSGRLRAPDGTVMRLGYAGQNGHAYTGLGTIMRQRGLIGSGPGQFSGSMQGIMEWLRSHPDEGREIMRQNRSFIFFRETSGDGPVGALNVPVRAHSSVAADPKFVPLGAPVWLAVDRAEANGLWIAQDTGGAIKGANRFDTFWGAGPSARQIAGGMAARGTALLLLPKGTLDRLGAR